MPDLPLFLAVLRARQSFYFRRHRSAAFCRRTGRADAFAVRSQLSPRNGRRSASGISFSPAVACTCDGNVGVCQSASHCLAAITPEQVFAEYLKNWFCAPRRAGGGDDFRC